MRTLVVALALVGCPKKDPEPQVEPEPRIDVSDHMAEHFLLGSRARDAVIDGELDQARAHMAALANHPADDLPDRWQDSIQAVKQAAQAGAEAANLEAAGLAVAQVAQACGACHSREPGGPEFEVPVPPPPSKPVAERMERHQWGASRMWEGMVQPSEELFESGASALADSPLWRTGDVPEEELPGFVVPMEERVRTLAEDSRGGGDRVTRYGNLLATCAGCHFVARNPGQ